jgi:hypothetical protein
MPVLPDDCIKFIYSTSLQLIEAAVVQPRLVIKKSSPTPLLSAPCKRRPSKFLRVRYEMAPYDSDSSDGEENDYTVTSVLLGYTSNEAKDDNISHLGGSPVC